MRFSTALFLSLCISSQPPSAFGGTCTVYQNRLSDGSLGICAGIVDYEYYKETDKTQAQLETLVGNSLAPAEGMTGLIIPLLPVTCKVALKALACSTAFPRCGSLDTFFMSQAATSLSGTVTVFPRFACRSTCDAVAAACPQVTTPNGPTSLLAVFNAAPNCSATTALAGVGNYPTYVPATHPLNGDDATNLGGMPWAPLVAAKAAALVSMCTNSNCEFSENTANMKITESLCFSTPEISAMASAGVVHPGGAILPTNNVCASTLAMAQCNENTGLAYASCIHAHAEGKSPLSYFVPVWPGMPPLRAAAQHQFGAQPSTLGALATPLCSLGGSNSESSSSSESCLAASAGAALDLIPPFLMPKCRAALQRLICASAYMPLEEKLLCLAPDGTCNHGDPDLGFAYALPRFPAESVCEEANRECAGAPGFPQSCSLPQAAISSECDAQWTAALAESDAIPDQQKWACTSAFQGLPSFPVARQTFVDLQDVLPNLPDDVAALLGSSAATAFDSGTSCDAVAGIRGEKDAVAPAVCSNGGVLLLGGGRPAPSECPEPLLVPDPSRLPSRDDSAQLVPYFDCAMDCFSPIFSQASYRTMLSTQLLSSGLAVLLLSVVLVTHLASPKLRKNHSTNLIIFASWNVSLTVFLPNIFEKNKDTLCWNANTPVTQARHGIQKGSRMCIAQGVSLSFWILVVCYLWCQSSLQLRARVFRQRVKKTKRGLNFPVLLPAIQCAILLGMQEYGNGGAMYCLFGEGASRFGELPYWVLFYFPISCCWLIGTGSLFSAIRQMSKVMKYQGIDRKGLQGPLLYTSCFSLIIVPLIFLRSMLKILHPSFVKAGQEWAACLLTNAAAGVANPATNCDADVSMMNQHPGGGSCGCGLSIPGGMPIEYPIAFQSLLVGQAYCLFLIYGCKIRILKFWYRAFRNCCSGGHSLGGGGKVGKSIALRGGGGANEEDEKGEDEEGGGADKSHGIQMMEMVRANRGVVESAASCRVAIAEVVTQPQASGDSPSRANRRYSTSDPDEGPVGDENMKSKSTRRYSTT